MSLRKAAAIFRSNRLQNGLSRWQQRIHASTCIRNSVPLAATSSGAMGSENESSEYFRQAVAAFTVLAGISSSGYLRTTKCDEPDHDEDEDEDYDVFSSSDPMFLPNQSEDGIPLDRIYLTDITSSSSKSEELKDESSDFSKSVRAFGSCLESTAAIRRRSTPLATYSSEDQSDDNSNTTMTAEDRMSSLSAGSRDNETVTTRNVYFYKASQIHDGVAGKFVLLAGPSSEDLGGDIGHLLGVGVSRAEVGKFADG